MLFPLRIGTVGRYALVSGSSDTQSPKFVYRTDVEVTDRVFFSCSHVINDKVDFKDKDYFQKIRLIGLF